MKLEVIKNQENYNEALERLAQIFDAKKGTPNGYELDRLSFLIDMYEKDHFPIGNEF